MAMGSSASCMQSPLKLAKRPDPLIDGNGMIWKERHVFQSFIKAPFDEDGFSS